MTGSSHLSRHCPAKLLQVKAEHEASVSKLHQDHAKATHDAKVSLVFRALEP